MTETTPSMRSKWLGCQASAGPPGALPTSARCEVGGWGGAEGPSGLFPSGLEGAWDRAAWFRPVARSWGPRA